MTPASPAAACRVAVGSLKMRLWILPGVILILFSCGATKTNVVDMGSGLRPQAKPKSCTMQIFRTQRPSKPYHELATIESIGAAATSSEAVNEDLKETACKLGADAIIITDVPGEKPGCGGYSGPSVKGVAIVYQRPSGATEAVPSAAPPARQP
jgi:hypothetical protein